MQKVKGASRFHGEAGPMETLVFRSSTVVRQASASDLHALSLSGCWQRLASSSNKTFADVQQGTCTLMFSNACPFYLCLSLLAHERQSFGVPVHVWLQVSGVLKISMMVLKVVAHAKWCSSYLLHIHTSMPCHAMHLAQL